MLRCGGCVSAIELNHLDPPRLDGCANPILNLSWPPAAHRICGDCRLRFLFAGGPWARPSPGIPCALSFPEGQNLCKTRARGAAGKLILVLTKLFDTLHRKIGAMSRFLPRGGGGFRSRRPQPLGLPERPRTDRRVWTPPSCQPNQRSRVQSGCLANVQSPAAQAVAAKAPISSKSRARFGAFYLPVIR
jgi:hypothetical protein